MSRTGYRSRAELVIAVDDTDCPGEGGTGRVARTIAERLAERHAVWGVTRHQLAILPEINYTARNSANVLHLREAAGNVEFLAAQVAAWVDELALAGSEPGLCVAPTEALLGCGLGHEAQVRFVTREEVRREAEARGVHLQPVREADGGLVGAFCGACLAAQGNDGRFVQVGGMRALSGEVTVAQVLAAGADRVLTGAGEEVRKGTLAADRLRPALQGGQCVLYVERLGAGRWRPVKGRPGDP